MKSSPSSGMRIPHSKLLRILCFISPLILEAGILMTLAAKHISVLQHDTFYIQFCLQFFFLNSTIQSGEIPLWFPHVLHGMPTGVFFYWQAGLFQSLMLLSHSFLSRYSFFDLFHLGIFLDHALFFLGSWMLAEQYFARYSSRLFVLISLLGSTLWSYQTYFNLHTVYLIPLLIHLIIRFLTRRNPWILFLICNLFFIQGLGNNGYMWIVQAFGLGLFALSWILFCRDETFWKDLARGIPSSLLSLLMGSIPFLLLLWDLHRTSGGLVPVSPDRLPDQTVGLSQFLTYSTRRGYSIWQEAYLRFSPGKDYSIYAGMLTFCFAVYSLQVRRKEIRPLQILFLAWVLLSSGGYVSALCYEWIPGFDRVRHLSMMTCMARMVLCFLAGFGWESFLDKDRSISSGSFHQRFVNLAPLFLTGFALFFIFVPVREFQNFLVSNIILELTVPEILQKPWPLLSSHLIFSFLLCVCMAFGLLRYRNRGVTTGVIAFLLMTHLADLYEYKILFTCLDPVSLTPDMQKAMDFHPVPFTRMRSLKIPSPSKTRSFHDAGYSAQEGYSFSDEFFERDGYHASRRVDLLALPLYEWVKKIEGQDPSDRMEKPMGFRPPRGMAFNLDHEFDLQIHGNDPGKIQCLQQLPADRPPLPLPAKALKNHRVLPQRFDYEINQFSANRLELTLKSSTPESDGSYWLYYSNVWDSHWNCEVDGKQIPIHRAGGAYQGVQLAVRSHHLIFHYVDRYRSLLQWAFCLNSTVWLLALTSLLPMRIYQWYRISG